METPGSQSRLYLDDPYRLEFKARVVAQEAGAEGTVTLVLDRTCFYPTSGGQPHDTGTLNGIAVFDVSEDEAGRVLHHLRGAPGSDMVRGVVDGERRRHHMQQHSGQHLLSAAFVAVLQRETQSFHLGTERCSIDLPGAPCAAEALLQVERRANQVLWEGRPVHVRHVSADAWRALRKAPPPGLEQVRVVDIEGWDQSPCCGTHVRRTQEIGLVKLLGQERVRDTARVFFVCGERALDTFVRCLGRQEDLVARLTCHPDELAARVERLQDESRRLRRELETARGELAQAQAVAWIAAAPRLGTVPVIARAWDADARTLQAAAAALAARGAVALLAATGMPAQFLFVAPATVAVDLRPVLQAACVVAGGRGGGTTHRVQGAALRPEAVAEALAAAGAALRAQIDAVL